MMKANCLDKELFNQTFMLVEDFNDQIMKDFIGFARMVVFNEDGGRILLAKNEASNKFIESFGKKKAKNIDPLLLDSAFKGYLPAFSI